MWNMIFLVTGAIFILLLAAVFFSKEMINTRENKLFKLIIISNGIGYLIEIPLQLFVRNFGIDSVLIDVFCRLYLISITINYTLFTIYVFVICLNKKNPKYDNSIKTISSVLQIIEVLVILLLFILPFEKYYDISKMYIYGVALDLLKCCIVCHIGIYIILLLKNFRELKNKKYLPIYFIIILLIFMTILNSVDPSILITNMIVTYICYTMSFTIENPDMKLINQLELAKDQAEKANRAKTDFLSSMSHEIRTPLNAIVGFSECIGDADDLDQAKEDAKDIIIASQNLLEIVNGILDISKIEADKMEVVCTEYDLKTTLENLSKLIVARIGDKDIEFRTHFALDIPDVLYGDSGKVKQVMTNILTNAAKYTEKGFIDFTVKCVNKDNICSLIISVQDTGRGIKKENIDKLFDKFQRLDEDKNTTVEGTGLGLAITKRLVEMMGGKVVVQSEYGEGSTFTVYLNQEIRDDSYKKEDTIYDEIISFNNRKVLVVDDNKLNLKVAARKLKEYNLQVDCVDTAFECINKIENKEHYDIIFMDIMMPKMGGVEAFKKLKQIDGFDMPVIALTADAVQGKAEKYLEVGFNSYLSKPIEENALRKVLSKYLSSTKVKNVKVSDDEKVEEEKKSDEKVYDMDYLKEKGIDVDSSLELLGDMDMYNETLHTFVEENKERIPRIKKNKNDGNMKDYSIDVHALKSDSKYLGFKKLAELAYDHELKSKEDNREYISEHFDELMKEYNRIKVIVDNYLEGK